MANEDYEEVTDFLMTDTTGLAIVAAINGLNPNDAIRYSSQALTDAQKTQARNNIGAISASDISTKADKVVGATSGHLAGLDSNGNLIDSAIPASDITGIKNDLAQYEQNGFLSKNLLTINRFEVRNIGAEGEPTRFAIFLSDVCPELKAGDTVKFVFDITNPGTTQELYLSGTGRDFYNGAILTIQDADLNKYVYIYGKSQETTVYSNMMITKDLSATVEDFIPYAPSNIELSHLSNEALDIKMLGWSVPKESPVQNYMASNRVFHKRVVRYVFTGAETVVAWGSSYPHLFRVGVDFGQKASEESQIYMNGYSPYRSVISYNVNNVYTAINKDVVINDISCTTVEELKNAIRGKCIYILAENEVTMAVDGNEAVFNPLSGDLKFIAGKVNWNGVPEIFTIEQYSMYVVFCSTGDKSAIYIVNGIGVQAGAVKVAGDNLASFSINGFTVTANINQYCGYAIYRLTKDNSIT